jgi:putative tryptophan/tyrosine transport system substrate-binding protein
MSWSARWKVAGMFDLRRRNFIALVGGAAAWPLAARAQQPTVPVIGYLSQNTPEAGAALVAAVRKGLSEVGIVEGRDVTSELRWARYDVDRLPALATDLVQRRVAVIIILGTPPAARAAKAATTEIPIVFALGTDPVQVGLVESLNHPAGNITGITTMNLDIAPKWVALLHELLPAAKRFALLVNIQNADSARAIITGTQAAGFALGVQIEILFASNESELDAALVGLGARAQALIIHPEVLFLQNLQKLAALAVREKLPALYSQRAFPEAAGLMSYGSSFFDAHRQAGVYAGRILKGEKPGDLPVQRAARFELVLNLKTAKTIGIEIPATLLAQADEAIE